MWWRRDVVACLCLSVLHVVAGVVAVVSLVQSVSVPFDE